MHSPLWYGFTFGIPLLGVVICSVRAVKCFRWVLAERITRTSAAFIYLVATSFPAGLATAARKFGSYLAAQSENYAFFGEETWGLSSFMLIYTGLAVVSNVGLWVALARLKTSRTESGMSRRK